MPFIVLNIVCTYALDYFLSGKLFINIMIFVNQDKCPLLRKAIEEKETRKIIFWGDLCEIS